MHIISFIHDLTWQDIPPEVRHQAKRCLFDTIGVAIGGRQTELSQIIYNYAASAHGGSESLLWLDGRRVSAAGAVLAHGMTIDALDMHDSCRPVKGHAGVAQVPAALHATDLIDDRVDGRELITTLVMAYEIAIRAGTALHATACDYHTSGAWNALGCAAVLARRLGLTHEQTRQALGIAEYHGPRSQMMRCIDHPTMVKDGSGWGAMAGIAAAQLAAEGFTGAPALTVEGDDVTQYWASLEQEWSLMIQYFKPYAVCYWAQPAIAGALKLQAEHEIGLEEICSVQVHTFHEATRLATRLPQNTEEAQYSLPYPLAAALVHQRLGYRELSGAMLDNPSILALIDKIELIEDAEMNARFPADRLARVRIKTKERGTFDSGITPAKWAIEDPPDDQALSEKFHELTDGNLSSQQAEALQDRLWSVEELTDASEINRLLN